MECYVKFDNSIGLLMKINFVVIYCVEQKINSALNETGQLIHWFS